MKSCSVLRFATVWAAAFGHKGLRDRAVADLDLVIKADPKNAGGVGAEQWGQLGARHAFFARLKRFPLVVTRSIA